MANEGFLGKTTLGGEKAVTDDHPAIIHALPLDASATGTLAPGLIMERTATGEYKPFDPDGGGNPRAVVNEPCDTETETSVKCIVHGCVKTRLLTVGVDPADDDAIAALMDAGIFAA